LYFRDTQSYPWVQRHLSFAIPSCEPHNQKLRH
jgi:hypothetical protein